jgi:hypothetical protein
MAILHMTWTNVLCIRDLGAADLYAFQTPVRGSSSSHPGDVLLHSGDLSAGGYLANLKKTIDWLKMLDHPQKVSVHGPSRTRLAAH